MKLYFYVAIKLIFVHSIANGLYIMETVGVAFQEWLLHSQKTMEPLAPWKDMICIKARFVTITWKQFKKLTKMAHLLFHKAWYLCQSCPQASQHFTVIYLFKYVKCLILSNTQYSFLNTILKI